MEHNHQHQHFNRNHQHGDEYNEAQLSYPKILQWSIDKIAASRNARRSSAVDLRRGLLIAGAIGKARAGILRQRAMQFLEARPQLLPPTGWDTYHCASRLQQPAAPAPPEQEPEESAFGYATLTTTADDSDDGDDDALSVSAEAIVMSSVELSISGLEDDDTSDDSQSAASPRQLESAPASRKRKQQSQEPAVVKNLPPPPPPPQQQQQLPPTKRTRHPGSSSGGGEVDQECLRSLRASFVDLNIVQQQPQPAPIACCRQQANQFSGALVPWPGIIGLECHSFA